MLESIQMLRGLAAVMVVMFHYTHLAGPATDPAARWILGFGGSGVDIFFVISGFIMTLAHSGADRMKPGEFLYRRFVRIVPLYWVLTVLAFVSALLLAPQGVTARLGWTTFGFSMLFLPYTARDVTLDPAAAETYVLPMAWTLTFEWVFYLVFALALCMRLTPLRRLAFMTVCFGGAALLGYLLQPRAPILQVLTHPIAFEFLLGSVIGIAYQSGTRIGGAGALAAAACGAVLLAWPTSWRLVVWGGGAALLVGAAALYAGSANVKLSIMNWLGDMSYSLYLSHFFALGIFPKLQTRFPALGDVLSLPSIAAFSFLALLICVGSFYGIEKPVRTWFVRRRATASRDPVPRHVGIAGHGG